MKIFNKNTGKWGIMLIIILLSFLAGRLTKEEKTIVEYVPGKVVHDSISIPEPYYVHVPDNPILIIKKDTIKNPGKPDFIVEKIDTTSIIKEYIKEKRYDLTLFDSDTLGKLRVKPIIQYNTLQSLVYDFRPMTRKETAIKKYRITPFISTSVNSFGIVGIGGGAYYNSVGVEVKYLSNFQEKGLEVGMKIKF